MLALPRLLQLTTQQTHPDVGSKSARWISCTGNTGTPCLASVHSFHRLKAPRYSAVHPHLHVNDSLTHIFDLCTRIKCIFGGKKSSSSKSANKKLNYYMQLDHHTTLVDLTIAHQHVMFRLTDTKNSLATPIDPHSLATPINPHNSTLTGHTLDPHWPHPSPLTHWPRPSTHTLNPHWLLPGAFIPCLLQLTTQQTHPDVGGMSARWISCTGNT